MLENSESCVLKLLYNMATIGALGVNKVISIEIAIGEKFVGEKNMVINSVRPLIN